MKRILIPTDLSDLAWNAIVYAIQLFRDIPCEFALLNTYEVDAVQLARRSSSQKAGYLYETAQRESRKGLAMILDDIQNSKPSIQHSFKSFSRSGTLLNVIKDMMTECPFDMIIMGSKGATGAKAILLGSNAHKIINNIYSCPILMIPEEVDFKKIDAIAFATNFERPYFKSEIGPIADMAKNQEAIVRMIHVYRKPELSKKQHYNSDILEKDFKNVKYQFHVIPEFTTIEKAVQTFVEELEINMLAMINYKHGFLERLFRQPVIKKTAFHIKIPFLVIPSEHLD